MVRYWGFGQGGFVSIPWAYFLVACESLSIVVVEIETGLFTVAGMYPLHSGMSSSNIERHISIFEQAGN